MIPTTIKTATEKDEVREKFKRLHSTKYMRSNLHIQPRFDLLRRMRKAAVLVPLFYKANELHVLLTQRSHNVSSHRGDVAFPGGKMDESDKDEVGTAVREAHEEIGLDPGNVDVVSCFHPFVAGNGILCTPVVSFIGEDFVAKPNGEVDHVFSLPLSRFLSTDGLTMSELDFNGPSTVYWFHDEVDGVGFSTWGLTASMCIYVAMIAYSRKPDFEFYASEHFEKSNVWSGLEKRLDNHLNRLAKL